MSLENSACLFLLFVSSVAAAQCAAPPLNLPVRTASVVPGILSHGIPVSIGTPPQHIILTPSLQLDTPFIPRYTNSCIYSNNTSVPADDTKWTDQDGRLVCAHIYGGGFVPKLSSTFLDNSASNPVSEAWFKNTQFLNWRFMTDSFTFTDYIEAYAVQNDVLPNKRSVKSSFILPNEGAPFGDLSTSALSLTPGSRLLETLAVEGVVPSKSWSLSSTGLCLGCMDANEYTGEFRTFEMADRAKDDGLPCLLQVIVESLDYHAEPTSEGLPLIENAFAACVDPGVRSLVLPPGVRAKLLETGEGTAKALSVLGLGAADSSNTSSNFLRFKLEGGLQVDVGKTNATSVSDQVPSNEDGSWGAYGKNVPVLGQPFTSSLVLRWDETKNEYGLANRNTKTYANSNLSPLGCDNFPSITKAAETTPNVGFVVGSIIGGFVAGLLFAAVALFFYWRGQRGVKSKYEAMRGEDAVSLRTVNTGGRTLDSRMSGASGLQALSMRESLRSHFSKKSVSPSMEPSLVGDSQVFEAPEGGTAYPSKRSIGEMHVYSYDDQR